MAFLTAPERQQTLQGKGHSLTKSASNLQNLSLGGSTTLGRPYDDKTSFSGWLRRFLTAADRNKEWEVINVGGIRYTSYHIAHFMEELVRYQPDLYYNIYRP